MTRAMVWFRRDLSLEDNLAWSQAIVDHAEVLPVYILDHRLLDAAGPYRRRQFIASLAALADELRVVGGHLTVADDDPVEAVTRLAREHGAHAVYWNNDVTRFARTRDDAAQQSLLRSGISVERSWSTLVHPPGTFVTAGAVFPASSAGSTIAGWMRRSRRTLPPGTRACSRSRAARFHRSTAPHQLRRGAR